MDKKKICDYCDNPILPDEPTVKDMCGDDMHLSCAAEEAEGDEINNRYYD